MGERYALIHADDVADLFVGMSEKAAISGGKIMDAASAMTESTDHFPEKCVDVTGIFRPTHLAS
jgi:hypothetical protein